MIGSRWVRAGVMMALLGGGAGGVAKHVHNTLPKADNVATGVLLDGRQSNGQQSASELVQAATEARLDRQLSLSLDGKAVWTTTARELGATIPTAQLEESLLSVGRADSWWQRYDEARQAQQGHRAVAMPIRLPATKLAERLAAMKAHYDQAPRSARWDFAKDAPSEHHMGRSIDVYGSVEAVLQAIRSGADAVDIVVERQMPRASQALVASIDRSQLVGEYRTRFGFVGNQQGRAQNVARAAAGIDGLVMMPGEVVSFNHLVGPRSLDNGFAQAGEIYKGEMRMGIGGGTCQVASTFHAAAYLGGLEVVQRSPHSRPSGYIGVGLDATVAYPHVDLKMKNPFDFPIIVRATAHKGEMHVALYGRLQPATVDFNASTVGIKKFKRTVRTGHWLAEGKTYRKQKGRRGMTIKKVRRIHFSDGRTKVETTNDVYPPTNEVYYVAPGTDPETSLPPLPEDATG